MDDICFLCLRKITPESRGVLAIWPGAISWCSDCLVAFGANFDEQQRNLLIRLMRKIADQDERIAKLERGDLGG